jgi:hypothetical protein
MTKCDVVALVCILVGADTRASGLRGCFTKLLEYQDFWCTYSMLKEFYCISEAPVDVLKFEL